MGPGAQPRALVDHGGARNLAAEARARMKRGGNETERAIGIVRDQKGHALRRLTGTVGMHDARPGAALGERTDVTRIVQEADVVRPRGIERRDIVNQTRRFGARIELRSADIGQLRQLTRYLILN